jgi:putative FmdB family regulatory protein
MPTYEYRCRNCGHHIEVVQSFTDDPLTVCAHCGGSLRKVFSPVGVVLKGSGFYRTDNRSSGSKDGKRKEPAAASGGSSESAGSTTKSDSGSSSTKSDAKTA